MNKIFITFILLTIIFFTNTQFAREILIYADSISYDNEKNLIARGNAKIISNDEIITSDLVIVNREINKIILPTKFNFKDNKNNYYSGSSGIFSKNFEHSEINDVKLKLSDGSRIVGKKAIKNNDIEIVTKGSFTACNSKINIKNFICPIWQIDGEKILHDSENLFLYQKHAKIKIFNLPILYVPYLVTPSPLRKERKSGFLTPSMRLNFLDSKTSQSLRLPYYFNLDIDKELTFTPIINYGGGVDSSQRMLFDYNQIISGGYFNVDLSMDTTIENQNNEDWFQNGSIVTNYNKNINEKFNFSINSALQTSRTYIRNTDPNNLLSYETSLSSTLNINGYNFYKNNDQINFNISTYQVVQANEDNKKIPTVLPYVKYIYEDEIKNNINYRNEVEIYNIFRDLGTEDHAQKQKKVSLASSITQDKYIFNSKVNFKAELHNQYFITENKVINDKDESNENYRLFPMTGLFIETPLKYKNKEYVITPKIGLIMNSHQKNSLEISNEVSTNNNFNLISQSNLNRFKGTDKLDNSKRMFYNFDIKKENITINLLQNYEFTPNSDYNKEIGIQNHLSDLLVNSSYEDKNYRINHNLRYNPHIEAVKKQEIEFKNTNILGDLSLKYLDEKKDTNNILENGNEVITFGFKSKKFKEFSDFNINSSYNLIEDKYNEYALGYNYYDECFGIKLDFQRKFYEDTDLKPRDTLTLMFSFKHLGSYKSTNLAVSENDKQDIEWIATDANNELFN